MEKVMEVMEGRPVTLHLTKPESEIMMQLILRALPPEVQVIMQKLATATQEASQPPKDE